MPVTPSGPLSLPFALMREIIAAAPTWQTICDVDTAAEALTRVHEFGFEPAADVLPCCIVGDEDGLEQILGWDSTQHGQVLVEFLLPLTDDDARELQYTFRNQVGAILKETLALRAHDNTRPGVASALAVHLNLLRWRKLVSVQEITDGPRYGIEKALWAAFIGEWN